MTKQYQTAVVIGRMQLYHLGHETLMLRALELAEQVIVVLGSAHRSRNSSNPFTWVERKEMIQSSLAPQDVGRVKFLPVRDYFDDNRWDRAVGTGVQALGADAESTVLVGFEKDHTSYYLARFPQWALERVAPKYKLDATMLRDVYFSVSHKPAREQALQPCVPAGTLAWLQAWADESAFYDYCRREHHNVGQERRRLTAESYLAADALVVCQGHVLMVQRAGPVGAQQWALPGGFLSSNELFYAGCLRELRASTGFELTYEASREVFKDSQVFDHYRRSPRARVVSQVFRFDLKDEQLPVVFPSEELMHAKWIPIKDLPELESSMFEDTAVVVDHFVGLFPDARKSPVFDATGQQAAVVTM